jgi:hypothetical protein
MPPISGTQATQSITKDTIMKAHIISLAVATLFALGTNAASAKAGVEDKLPQHVNEAAAAGVTMAARAEKTEVQKAEKSERTEVQKAEKLEVQKPEKAEKVEVQKVEKAEKPQKPEKVEKLGALVTPTSLA